MIRLLWIPVAGTVAALIAISLTHAPQEDSPYPNVPPRAQRPPEEEVDDAPELPLPPPPTPPSAEPEQPPAPKTEFVIRLHPDGSLEEEASGDLFPDIATLLERLAPADAPRPRLVVTNASDEVTEAALDAALAELRGRCDVRKDYSAPSPNESD